MDGGKFDRDQVFDYINTADSWININDTLGSLRIKELMQPLIDSINDEGGVSYVLGDNHRYRTSTLATVLDALFDVKLLPLSAVHQMQRHLYELKDTFHPIDSIDDVIDKSPEDVAAWGIDEAPSVWTTSMAIIALMNTEFASIDTTDRDVIRDLRESVYWLADQAYIDGGWGYQKFAGSASCVSSVPMTALAMKAILLAQRDGKLFNSDARNNRKFSKITSAIVKGKDYLFSQKKEDQDYVYWEYDGKEAVSITTWVLETLSILAKSNFTFYKAEEFEILKKRVVGFIYSRLPDNKSIGSYSQSERFFIAKKADGLKYKQNLSADKSFYTFKPFIVSKLLDLGEDPQDPKIVLIVKWLLENREKHWIIQEYNEAAPCSISAAMAINVIVKWLQRLSELSLSTTVSALLDNKPLIKSKRIPKPWVASLWVATSFLMYFPINYVLKLPFLKDIATNMFSGQDYFQIIILGALGSILGGIITWLFSQVVGFFKKKMKLYKKDGDSNG